MIYFFQYYRVLMIIFVLCRHLHTIFPNELLFDLLDGGSEAVSFFFILSGFLQYNSIQKNQDGNYKTYLGKLIKKKKSYFIQYYLYLIIACIYHFIIHTYKISDLFKKYFLNSIFISTFHPVFNNSILGSAWFFVDLVICMLLAPIIFNIINKNKYSTKEIFCLLALHILCNITLTNNEYYFWIMYYSIYIRLIEYIIGMLLAKIKNENFMLWNPNIAEIMAIFGMAMLHFLDLLLKKNYIFHYSLITVANSFLIYVFSYQSGIISSLCVKNYLVDRICKYSFTIYIFNFIFLLYSVLTPWSPSPYLNLLVTLVMLYFTGIGIDYIIHKMDENKGL